MRIDELSEQFSQFVERARVVLHREIEEARAAVKVLNAEKATAQAALSDLQSQTKSA
jgi:hypothetical protein